MYMIIGDKTNVTAYQSAVKPKELEREPSDLVVLGGNEPDSSLLLGEQLKNMKAFDSDVYEPFINALGGAGIGGLAGSLGGGILAAVCGAGGWLTLGAVLLGGAVGTGVGATVGWNKKH
ncbi:MAG: hypothetical protein BWY64_01054 [bacterium ADurb.Bin363]|nr:MAG: hypothetical protein BWY64_01054 [bacterium ADurb.Bin363]